MNFKHHIAGKLYMQRETANNGDVHAALSCHALTSNQTSCVSASVTASPFQIVSEIAL